MFASFAPVVERIEERIVPCCTPVHCPPPVHCVTDTSHCYDAHQQCDTHQQKCDHKQDCDNHHQNCNNGDNHQSCNNDRQNCNSNGNNNQHCNDHQQCDSHKTCNSSQGLQCNQVADGNAQALNVRYIVDGKSYTSLSGNDLQSGQKVTVVFDTAAGTTPTTFSLVSYNATSDFNLPDQTIYQVAEVTTCGAGEHCLTVTVPCGYFQLDFVKGGPIDHFTNSDTYHGENRYIGGMQGGSASDCGCETHCAPPTHCAPAPHCDNNDHNKCDDHQHNKCDDYFVCNYDEHHNHPVCDDHHHHHMVCDDHGHNKCDDHHPDHCAPAPTPCQPGHEDCKEPQPKCKDDHGCNDDHHHKQNCQPCEAPSCSNAFYYFFSSEFNNNFSNGGNVVNNNYFNNSNLSNNQFAYSTSFSGSGQAPNIHDVIGPTEMDGADMKFDKSAVDKWLNPNGSGDSFKGSDIFEDKENSKNKNAIPFVLPDPCQPVFCPPPPCRR